VLIDTRYGRPQGPCKPKWRARYSPARPLSQVNPVCRQRPRTVEGASALPPDRRPDSVRLGFLFPVRSLKGLSRRPLVLASGARPSGSVTRRTDHFTRREHRCRSGPSQAWLRRFNSAFVSLFSGLQTLRVKSRLLSSEKYWRTATGCKSEATHHFRIRGEITIILRFERRVCRLMAVRKHSCRMRQFMPR